MKHLLILATMLLTFGFANAQKSKDNIAVRRGNQIIMDYNFDGQGDKTFSYGNGSSEDQYLVGDWDGK